VTSKVDELAAMLVHGAEDGINGRLRVIKLDGLLAEEVWPYLCYFVGSIGEVTETSVSRCDTTGISALAVGANFRLIVWLGRESGRSPLDVEQRCACRPAHPARSVKQR
jgi:hypothetical protein